MLILKLIGLLAALSVHMFLFSVAAEFVLRRTSGNEWWKMPTWMASIFPLLGFLFTGIYFLVTFFFPELIR